MRLGIFGGTFDPIHFGHLRMAEEVRGQIGLDRVVFVPNRVSPFKTGEGVTDGPARAEMIRRAIDDNPAFDISTIEIDRVGPSYSVDTVRALHAREPDAELFFLTGTDALAGLVGWREPEALLELATFVAVARPGTETRDVLDRLPDAWEPHIVFVTMPGLDISATDLRARVRSARSIRYLTPPAVAEYIAEHGLYRD